jgi:hypothetical protein
MLSQVCNRLASMQLRPWMEFLVEFPVMSDGVDLTHLGRSNIAIVVEGVKRLQLSKWHAICSANSHSGLKDTRSSLRSLSTSELRGEQRGKSPCELRPSSSAQPSKVK